MLHEVKQGECLSSIAEAYGFADWHTIYDHPQNGEFRRLRPNPNLIHPGDELYIPDVERREEEGPTEKRHRFKARVLPTYLNVRVQDPARQPIANARYRLQIDTLEFEGKTNGEGWLKHKVPASAELGLLMVWPNPDNPDDLLKWEVKLGHLDPLETTSGIKARLRNLEYYSGEVNDGEDEAYDAAVRRFQEDNGLVVDGIVGPKTRNKLKGEHRV